jgi:hypothetical protein
MTTYTTIDRGSGEMLSTGLTATDAAHEVLTDDGRSYELRRAEDGEGFDLWSRQQVANRGWGRTRFFSLGATEGAAWAEIAQEVVDTHDAHAPGSHGPEVMTDAQYREMLAQLAEDEG